MARPFTVIGFTIFFTLTLIFELGQKAAVVILSAAAAAFVFSLFFESVRRDFVIPTACIAAAVAVLLSFAASSVPVEASERFCESAHTVKASVVSLEERRGERYYTQIKTSEIDGEEYKLNIRLSSKTRLGFKPYDTVEGELQLYDLGKTRSARNYYLSENVFTGGYARGDITVSRPESRPPGYYFLSLRAYIKNTVSRLVPGERGALATALLIGDKSELPKSVSAAFSSAGISHLIAVSGLHLSVWCLFILKIFDIFRLKSRIGAVISAVFVIIFMAVSGFTYSVMRAGLMMLVMLLGTLISRQSDSLNSLGAALVILCFINPYCVMSLGLRLSFLSTLGIIVGYGNIDFPLNPYIERVKNKYARRSCEFIFGSVRSTVLACAFTLPVMILDLGKVSLISIPANIIADLPASACMILAGLTALTAKLPFLRVITAGLADITGVCASFLINLSKALAAVPHSSLNTTSFLFPLWLVFAFIVLAAVALIYRFRKRSALRAAALICAFTFFGVCAGSYAISRTATVITVADVGNGSAAVVSSGGKTALLGCGGDSYYALSNIESAMDSVGADKLDFLLIPRISKGESSLALDAIDSFSPDYILTGELDSNLEEILKTENYALAPAAEISVGNAELKYRTTDKTSIAVLKAKGADTVFVFRPSYAPNIKGDILILRENLPQGVSPGNFNITALSADENRTPAVMGKLLSLGADAYATGGQGNIRITVFPSGKIFAERVD